MAESDSQSADDKTEEPTQHKIDKFREEGNVAQSKEVTSLVVLFGCMMVMYMSGPKLLSEFFSLFRAILSNAGTFELTNTNIGNLLLLVVNSSAKIVLPIAFAGFVAGIIGSLLQVGFNISLKPLEPQLKKINPLSGLKKIASMNSMVEGIKSILKLLTVIIVTYLLSYKELEHAPSLYQYEASQLFSYMSFMGFKLIGGVAFALIVVAAMDLAYQKYSYIQKLRMTKKEVRDENKEREGDPMIKARMRALQRDMSRKRMMESVPEADVVITNPTHIAVAIKYDSENMMAPKVVAKGADFVAAKIREIAKKSEVPLVENVPLARALHKTVKVGEVVPRTLYKAVAEVLAFVYKIKGKFRNYKKD